MANTTSTQILVDGPRNVVYKIDGYLDTSDLAASGSLTGGATTTGSAIITYTSSTAPLVGQFITGTGIPTGTYIVSVDSATQSTLSAAATATNTGLTFTLVAGAVVMLDPAKLSSMVADTEQKASTLNINRIVYTVDEGLAVRLSWNATAAVSIISIVKAGHQEYHKEGGLKNNAGTGKDGKILISTEGWSAGKIYEFSLVVDCFKRA